MDRASVMTAEEFHLMAILNLTLHRMNHQFQQLHPECILYFRQIGICFHEYFINLKIEILLQFMYCIKTANSILLILMLKMI